MRMSDNNFIPLKNPIFDASFMKSLCGSYSADRNGYDLQQDYGYSAEADFGSYNGPKGPSNT